MIKIILKYVCILLVIPFIWFVSFLITPFHATSVMFNVLAGFLVPSIATIFSITFTFWIAPHKKLLACIIALIICGIIAYPVYGPGQTLDKFLFQVFQISNGKYLPSIGVFISGIGTIWYCALRSRV